LASLAPGDLVLENSETRPASPSAASQLDARPPITVCVVSDQFVVRAGLRMFLGAAADLQLVAETGSGPGVLATIEGHAPTVIVVDCDGEPGVDLLRKLGLVIPTSKLLVFSGKSRKRFHRSPLPGVNGVVAKEAPIEELLEAIRCVGNGGRWFSGAVARPLDERRFTGAKGSVRSASRVRNLTPRQQELVVLVGEGLRNHEIAERIGVTEKTVRNQLSSVFERLGVGDRLKLAVYAHTNGLIPAGDRLASEPAREKPAASE
jgi:DNA-binding NarL/FixJ family response regulator